MICVFLQWFSCHRFPGGYTVAFYSDPSVFTVNLLNLHSIYCTFSLVASKQTLCPCSPLVSFKWIWFFYSECGGLKLNIVLQWIHVFQWYWCDLEILMFLVWIVFSVHFVKHFFKVSLVPFQWTWWASTEHGSRTVNVVLRRSNVVLV